MASTQQGFWAQLTAKSHEVDQRGAPRKKEPEKTLSTGIALVLVLVAVVIAILFVLFA